MKQQKIFGFILMGSLFLVGCSKAKPAAVQEDNPQTTNAVTTYVGSLQQDVKKAQGAVEKMNEGINKTEVATNEAN